MSRDTDGGHDGFRLPTCAEANVIRRLLAAEFPGKDELVEQLRNYRVRIIDNDGTLELLLGDVVKATRIEKPVPVEGEAADVDGNLVHFLLHVVEGFAVELEVYKDGGTPIQRLPTANELEVIVLGK